MTNPYAPRACQKDARGAPRNRRNAALQLAVSHKDFSPTQRELAAVEPAETGHRSRRQGRQRREGSLGRRSSEHHTLTLRVSRVDVNVISL